MVTLVSPELVKVSSFARLLPTATFPKLRLGDESTRLPAAIAFAEAETLIDGCEALLEMTIAAEELPGAFGVKRTINLIPLPRCTMAGKVGEIT
jgi:hypothetical protein